jgi:FkbM family methyltransferase
MNPWIRLVGRAWPAALVSNLSELTFDIVNVQRSLGNGRVVKMRSNSDVVAFNDIFRRGEYDEPITHMLTHATGRRVRVLDLGADSGFFTQRMIQRIEAFHSPLCLSACLVEGSPRNFARLQQNVALMPAAPHIDLTLVHGLVGKRSGIGLMRERVFNAMNRIDTIGVAVPYVDVSRLVTEWPRIDLVKCDIEGSEGDFLASSSYPDVMTRAAAAVLELHEVDRPEIAWCRRLLTAYGFVQTRRLRAFADNTVEFFWK